MAERSEWRKHFSENTVLRSWMVRSDHLTPEEWDVVDRFHALNYERSPQWLGIPVLKTVFDLFIYQQLLVHTRPDTIIECGTGWGGSTLFLASMCDLIGCGQILSIDVCTDIPALYRWVFGSQVDTVAIADKRPEHPRITYITGNTLDPEIIKEVKRFISRTTGRVMVILDSDHHAEYVLAECEAYGPLVSKGCYLCVEDVDINGHPLRNSQQPAYPGPFEAVQIYLHKYPEFKWDVSPADQYLITATAHLIRTEG